jgi:hypothetical protein
MYGNCICRCKVCNEFCGSYKEKQYNCWQRVILHSISTDKGHHTDHTIFVFILSSFGLCLFLYKIILKKYFSYFHVFGVYDER